MKAIIDDKMYDTETAERIYGFQRRVTGSECLWRPGYYYTDQHSISVYKTPKGSYFEHDEKANTITLTTKEKVMEITKRLDPDEYIKIFEVEVEAG